MKAATTAVRELLQESTEIRATPKLRIEFEHNRYSKIKAVNTDGLLVAATPVNDPTDNDWNTVFDLNSITLPNRPGTGIAKARLSEPIKLSVGFRDKPQPARFYAPSAKDTYRYWSAKVPSNTTPVATADYNLPTPVKLAIMYEEQVIGNKVVVGFETSYARPKSYDIQIATVANPTEAQWKTIASNVVPNTTTGRVELWMKNDGSDTWDATPVYDSLTWINGVRLVVRSMTEGKAYLDVIQLGARLERDVSDLVIGYSKNFEVSDRSFIAPLGEASSNEASVELTNFDRLFDNTNEASIFYGLIDAKAKFTLDLSIDARPAGSADERIRELTMWVDSWGGQDEDSVSVKLKDSSIFLQEIEMPKVFWENVTVGAIIWQIMDTAGLTNYSYNLDVLDTGQIIPYFWSFEGTAWEQISNLSQATQTGVYFDEWDVMQIKTRKSLFGTHKSVDWNLDAVQNAQKLPDVISVSNDDSLVVNQVDINWKPAEFKEVRGVRQTESVWEPKEETVILRGAALLRDMAATSGDIYITSAEAAKWPYDSYVNIRGEIMRYVGKEYYVFKAGGGTEYKVVKSIEEKKAIDDASDPALSYANNWTGRLMVTERGVSASGKTAHKVKQTDYTASIVTRINGTFLESRSNWHHQKDGFVQLSVPANKPDDLIYVMRPNATVPTSNTIIGARIRFPSKQIRADQWAVGGLQFASDFGDIGYYLELMPTKNAKMTGEVNLWMGGAGSTPLQRAATGMAALGSAANVVYDKWYDLEVTYKHMPNGSAVVTAFLDGVQHGFWSIPANKRWTEQGNFGVYARGSCVVDVENLYSVWNDPNGVDHAASPDDSTFLDLTKGSLSSGYIEREWKFSAYTQTGVGALGEGKRRLTHIGNRAFYYYDEFGPVVHEMREFDIEFEEDDVPALNTSLYLSNNTQVVCTDYSTNAFGAKFTLVNASRQDAVVHGEDSITLGIDDKVEQKMFIYGHKLFEGEENVLTEKDEDSIRIKGKVVLAFDSPLIQTEKMAKELSAWVVELWSMGADELSVEAFGNPLFQLGDLVTMNYPAKGMYPTTHKYYIVSIGNDFDEGLTTKLILRRSK